METNPDELDKVRRVNQWILGRLREVRELQGMTQADVSDRMGDIDRSRISDTESGKYSVKLTTFLRFLHALDMDLAVFVSGCPSWRSRKKKQCILVDHEEARRKLIASGFSSKQVDRVIASLTNN